MKNARIHLFLLITCLFAAFTAGMFAGRNFNRAPVQIQSMPTVPPAVSVTQPKEAPMPTQPQIVNINTATSEQLQSLPGIGPVIAQRIIDYRQENGLFETVGELANVSGIGEQKLEAIWDLVITGG